MVSTSYVNWKDNSQIILEGGSVGGKEGIKTTHRNYIERIIFRLRPSSRFLFLLVAFIR